MNLNQLTTLMLIVSLAFSACETIIDPDLSAAEKKLVVYAHIPAGKKIAEIFITHSNPDKNGVYIPVENATFELLKDDMLMDNIDVQTLGPKRGIYTQYTVDLKSEFQTGCRYTLKVSTEGDYPDAITEVIIPHASPNLKKFDYVNSTNTYETYMIRFEDDPSYINYYHILLDASNPTRDSLEDRVVQFMLETQADIIGFPANNNVNYPLRGGQLFDDSSFNGTTKELYINIPKSQFAPGTMEEAGWIYTLSMSYISESFYLFHKAISEQSNVPVPIFDNPPLPYSNIENGYGCFSAFNEKTDDVAKVN